MSYPNQGQNEPTAKQATVQQPTTQGYRPKPSSSIRALLDSTLASRAAGIPLEWRTYAKRNPDVLAEDGLKFVNGLSQADYFLFEQLAFALAQTAEKGIIIGTLTGDPNVQAKVESVIASYINELVGPGNL
jgi:hypothetical protein